MSFACPLCAAKAHRAIKVFDEGVVVGECLECGLLYTPLRHPSPDALFAGTDVTQLRVLLRPISRGFKRHYRQRSFESVLGLVRRHTQGRRLLDVGCAHGSFLRLAQSQGYEVTGIEPTPALAAFGREEWGLEILDGRLGEVDLAGREWDVVTFTDSLEYLVAPTADLRRLVAHLTPGGMLFAKVPNGHYFRFRHRVETLLARKLGQDEPFSPSRRVVHYTLQSLQRLTEAVGLENVKAGAAPVIDSPVWASLTGLWLEMESPWYFDVPGRVGRRLLRTLGMVEQVISGGRNHLSPSIFVLAKRSLSPPKSGR